MWPYVARDTIDRDKKIDFAADKFREYSDQKYTLPGYFKTWFSKTNALNDKTARKGMYVKEQKEMRTKQQIMKLAQRMVDQTKQKECHFRRIAQNVYDNNRAHLMAALNLERGGTEGGFFSQIGTNLNTPSSAILKRTLSAKKSVQKQEQSQQTSPMTETASPKIRLPSSFKRFSPANLTPEQKTSVLARFARGAAMLGLIDAPDPPGRAKRKLLGQDTPGGPA